MFKPVLEKIDEVDTKIGRASVLRYGNNRLLSFPSKIDSRSHIAKKIYYSTLQWPSDVELRRIKEFQSGPSLPGYMLLAIEHLFVPDDHSQDRIPVNKPRHIRSFIASVLSNLAAALIAGQ